MRLLVVGALSGTALAWIFRRQLLALGSGGVEAVSRAADVARDAVGGLDDAVGRAAGAVRETATSVADRPELDELTKEELYERARAAGIPGRSDMSKDELIAALRNHS